LNGHLEIAKWLYKINPNLDVSNADNQALQWSIYYGHNNIVEWILQIKPEINVSKYLDIIEQKNDLKDE
jgi:ankyrin repeat protein